MKARAARRWRWPRVAGRGRRGPRRPPAAAVAAPDGRAPAAGPGAQGGPGAATWRSCAARRRACSARWSGSSSRCGCAASSCARPRSCCSATNEQIDATRPARPRAGGQPRRGPARARRARPRPLQAGRALLPAAAAVGRRPVGPLPRLPVRDARWRGATTSASRASAPTCDALASDAGRARAARRAEALALRAELDARAAQPGRRPRAARPSC